MISMAEKAYSRLLRQIVSGKRPAGSKLPEETLCAELGVSRTPLREALQQLENEGLVERRPRYGCAVRRFDPQEIVELFECRALLEVRALELGFDRIPPAAVQQALRMLTTPAPVAFSPGAAPADEAEAVPATEAEQLRSASLQADRMLHALVADFCPNRVLRQLVLDIQRRTSPFRDDRTYRGDCAHEVFRERKETLEAMLRGDRAAACALLEKHIRNGASFHSGTCVNP